MTKSGSNLSLLALCGVIAPIFFAFMVIVEGFLVPGYNQVSQHISDLGAYALYGSYAVLQNLNFWVFGILVVAFALGLGRSLPGLRDVTSSLGLFGTMVFLAGVFPDQPFPWPGAVHGLVSIAAFISIILCQFLVWIRLHHTSGREEESAWGRYRTYSLVSGLLSVALIIGQGSFASDYVGVGQKAFIAVPWVWIEVMALRLFRLSTVESPSQDQI